ncbi:MAG: nitroreductase family protein [Vicinamibacteraceae bacterium]|nr:nitroreductase family protein [Vicinamibacteraceae bacterium]
MDAITCLKTRRSIRAFRPDPIPRDTLNDIVDCARLAPTAFNRQAWTFVVVQDAAARTRIAEATGHAAFITAAPVCIAVFCGPNEFWVEDGSAATENLLLAAHAHGLGACWVGGYQTPYAEIIGSMLGAPPDQRLLALVAIGVPAEAPEVEKRSLADVIRWERY